MLLAVGETRALGDLDDGALARLVTHRLSGDARAAEAELCRRFLPRLRAYGRRHLRREEDDDELAQRVLVVVIGKLRAGAVREPDRIASFVLGTARMTAREISRGGRERPLEEGEAEALPAPVQTAEPWSRARLVEALASLSERERSVIVLTYFGEHSGPEVARALGLSEGNVRVIRHRALARLRDELANWREHRSS